MVGGGKSTGGGGGGSAGGSGGAGGGDGNDGETKPGGATNSSYAQSQEHGHL